MRRVIASVRIATARAVVLLSSVLACASVVFPGAPVRAAETNARETLDRYFRLEWSKSGRNVNGYVYNSSNRRAAAAVIRLTSRATGVMPRSGL